MAEEVSEFVAPWVERGWRDLEAKYQAAIRIEKAYEYFIENYDDLYLERIKEATKDIEGASGGAIQSKEQAKAALGPVTAEGGSNWLAAQTHWRKFGLVTGFNMQSQKDSVLTDTASATKWEEWWAQFSEATADRVATMDEARALIADPVYITSVPGAPEPTPDSAEDYGSSDSPMDAAALEAVRARGRADGITITERSSQAAQYVANLGANPVKAFWKFNEAARQRAGEYSYVSSALKINLDDSDPGPLFDDYKIKIENFATATDAYRDGTKGHFISPQFLFYAQGASGLTDKASKLLLVRQQLTNDAESAATNPDRNPTKYLEVNVAKWGVSDSVPGQWNQWYDPDEDVWFNAPPAADEGGSDDSWSHLEGAPPTNCIVWPTLPIAKNEHASTWVGIYDEFQEGSGPVADFDALQVADYTSRHAGLTEDEKEDWLREGIESILDFFGAGATTHPSSRTDLQTLGVRESGQNISLMGLKREAKEKILRFRHLKPFDFQCFLVENIAQLADYQDRHAIYNNLLRLENGAKPGSTISVLNAKGRQGSVEKLMNLTPAVYALLTPYIRIYRVWYDKENGTIPVSQDEMPLPNYVPKDDIDRLLGKGGGRYRGWGLQSYNWSLEGLQPAAVDNNIRANLTFYFQSLQDFFQGSRAAGGATPKPIDLLISPPTLASIRPATVPTQAIDEASKGCGDAVSAISSRAYDGQYFRIKVVAGWSTPPNFDELTPEMDPAQRRQLSSALASTRTSLYLQQTRHHLNFNEDGSLTLSIDYVASLAGMLTSNRVDILGANTRETQAELAAIEEQIRQARAGRAELPSDESEASAEQRQEIDAFDEQLKKYITRKKEILNLDRTKKYKRFLARLSGRDATSNEAIKGEGPKIYSLEVDPMELFMPPLHSMGLEERQKVARRRMSTNATDRGYKVGQPTGVNTSGNLDLLATLDDDDESTSTEAKLKQQWEDNLAGNDAIYIPYFYLGDLIDSVIQNNPDLSGDERKFLMFLSGVEITDPLIYYQIANISAVLCADEVSEVEIISKLRTAGFLLDLPEDAKSAMRKVINIGSIPISLDQFSIWYKDKVVKPMRPDYYLMHFIKDICAELISDSLRTGCFETNSVNEIRFDTSPIHFHNKTAEGGIIVRPGKNQGLVRSTDLASYMGNINEYNDIPTDVKNMDQKRTCDVTQGLVLYSTDAKPGKRYGRKSYQSDLADGIYHNYIGSPVGLVKKINFERMDQPYLREAKIQKFGELGAQQLRELYTVNIEMVGNNLYKNGQYFFVDPTLVGGTADMARLLGIGGYFMASSVSHTIGPQGYTVTVQGLQQGLEFSDSPTVVGASFGAGGDPPIDDSDSVTARREAEEEATQRLLERYGEEEERLHEADRAAAAAREERRLQQLERERRQPGTDAADYTGYGGA